MSKITFEFIQDGNIEQCKELCNELMAFQKSEAVITPECFDSMNFETRMKKSYQNAQEKLVIVVKDNGIPVGYAFSTIDFVTEADRNAFPAWAPFQDKNDMTGFYPDWLELPQKIGCISNLYLQSEYRKSGLGAKLLELSLEWFECFPDCGIIFVYISNGNDKAYQFYLNHGFTYSHDVFDGFIKAAYKFK